MKQYTLKQNLQIIPLENNEECIKALEGSNYELRYRDPEYNQASFFST